MLARGAALLALVAATIAIPASAQTAPPPPVGAVPADTTTTDTALSLGTLQNRMTVPVSIGAKGPWGFVIDTGAERTVVSRELADQLGLAAAPDLRVVAMTGPKLVPSVVVPSLSVSAIPPTSVNAPALEERNLGAPGMLGIDALQGKRVDIDFEQSVMAVRPSHRHYVAAGNHGDEIVVVAKSMFGQLIVTDARWRGKRIAVVIDTGSSMTVGNLAFLALIQGRSRDIGPVTAISVTGAEVKAEMFVVDELKLGGIGLDHVPIAIADVAPFRRFGLEKRPALMLGMETLRMFRHVRIDFVNRAIEFVLPGPHGMVLGTPST